MFPTSAIPVAILTFKVLCAVACWIALLWTTYLVGPYIETRYNPVVSKLRIVEITEEAPNVTVIKTVFTKYRDCEYIGIAWFKGYPDGGFERVPVVLRREHGDNSSPNRPLGLQRSGPWQIGMSRHDLLTNSFAKLWHRCHIFWLTTTDYYP